MRRGVCIAVLLCLLLCGCAGAAEDKDVPLLILRYGENQPEDYPTTKAAEYFARLVEERTQGRICIRLYCNGELGDENQVFEQVQFGGIDMTRVSLGTLAEHHPEVEVLQLPFLYDDAEHMWRVLDGPIGEKFLTGTRQAGVIGLSWFDAGARPVQIPYNDVYSAMQTAKIDGAENNWPSYAFTGHFQAAPYFLLDEHSRLPEMQIMSTVALDKIAAIDEDYVTIVKECARECAIYERELWRQEEAASEKLVRDYGCVVTTLTDAQLEEFRRAVQPMYEEYPEEKQALIQKIRDS